MSFKELRDIINKKYELEGIGKLTAAERQILLTVEVPYNAVFAVSAS